MKRTCLSPCRPLITVALAILIPTIGCETQEVDPNRLVISTTQAPPIDTPVLEISLAGDFTSFDESQAAAKAGRIQFYKVHLDGRTVYLDDSPMLVNEGSVSFWAPAGPHVVELVEPNGHIAVQSTTFEIDTTHLAHVVAFGDRHALHHKIITFDLDVPSGALRYAVINLARGTTIEVVSCLDDNDPAACTPVGSPLAYGDFAKGEAPLDPAHAGPFSTAAPASGIGYRLSPSAAIPTPPPLPVSIEIGTSIVSHGLRAQPPIFFGAPIFFTQIGSMQEAF